MPILQYDGRKFADLTDREAEEVRNYRGMHLNFKGNLLKMAKVEIFNEVQISGENFSNEKTTEQLKDIIGEFENQINEHTEGVPSEAGKVKAILEGKLPDCGVYWLRDRGVAIWYLENGWLFTEKKEGQKRRWALTEKYNSNGLPAKEAALEELIKRRNYAQKMEMAEIRETVKSMG